MSKTKAYLSKRYNRKINLIQTSKNLLNKSLIEVLLVKRVHLITITRRCTLCKMNHFHVCHTTTGEGYVILK